MKTFIITMDNPLGRRRYSNVSAQCASEGLDYERIEGINGKALDSDAVAELATPFCAAFCTPGIVGCGASHIQLWKRIVAEQIPMALILEDDAVLAPGFAKKFQHIIQTNVPDGWHIVLAGCFTCNAGKPVAEALIQVYKFGGLHAYAISQEGARFLLKHAPKVQWHIDLQMAKIPGLRMYKCRKPLAFQSDMNASNIVESKSFPGMLNGILDTFIDEDISYARHMNNCLFRIGSYRHHVVITQWVFVMLVLGFLNFIPWQYVAIFVVLDTLLFPPNTPIDTFVKVSAFGLGLAGRSFVSKLGSRK